MQPSLKIQVNILLFSSICKDSIKLQQGSCYKHFQKNGEKQEELDHYAQDIKNL